MTCKRWLAALLAGILLFPGAAFSEGSGSTARDTAEIQKSLVSRESSEQTLEQHFLQLLELLKRDEIRHLLTIEDFSTITSEVIVKVFIWLGENRPVTTKILEALGISEADRLCVEKVWDSAERIYDAWMAYSESEDGQKLAAEAQALAEDPEFQEALLEFSDVLSSDRMEAIVITILDSALQSGEPLLHDGPLAGKVQGSLRENKTFAGRLFLLLMEFLDQTDWAREPVLKLLGNGKLWTFLLHAVNIDSSLDRVLEEELQKLAEDPDIKAFLERTVSSFYGALETFMNRYASEPETENNTEETAQ